MRSVRRAGWHHCCALTPNLITAIPAGLEGLVAYGSIPTRQQRALTMGSQFGSGGQRLFWEDARWGACWTVGMGVFGARLFPGVCGVQTASPYHWIDIVAINQHRKTAEEKDGLRGLHAMAQNDGYRSLIAEPKLTRCRRSQARGHCWPPAPQEYPLGVLIIEGDKAAARPFFRRKHRDEECPGI